MPFFIPPLTYAAYTALAAIAVSVLSGCSKDKNKSDGNSPDQYTPPKDLTYDRKCIFDSKCKPNHRIAAAYDYVGSVYGETGKVKYDNFLSAAESNYVELSFARISEPEVIPALLVKAQENSLRNFFTYSTPPIICNEPSNWSFLHGKNPQLGEGFILGGAHRCIGRFRFYFTSTGLEQSIASNPDEWIFLIEISKEIELLKAQGKDTPQDELALFYRVANRLGIPLENPLLPVDSEPVIKRLEKEGLPRIQLAASLVISILNNQIHSNPAIQRDLKKLNQEQLDDFLHRSLEKYLITRELKSPLPREQAATLGVDLGDLYKACEKFLRVRDGETRAQTHERVRAQLEKNMRKAIHVSNKLSVAHIREILKKYKKPKAFIQVGGLHAPIAREIYQDVKEIKTVPNFVLNP